MSKGYELEAVASMERAKERFCKDYVEGCLQKIKSKEEEIRQLEDQVEWERKNIDRVDSGELVPVQEIGSGTGWNFYLAER